MKFTFIDETPLSYLSRLDESIMPVVEDTEVLYEDADYSETVQEADNYRTSAEEVLGIELDGNQIQWLSDNFKAFYQNAEKYAYMKEGILQSLYKEGLLTDEEMEQSQSTDIPDEYDVDAPLDEPQSSGDSTSGKDKYDDDFSLEFGDDLERLKNMEGVPVENSAYSSPELGEASYDNTPASDPAEPKDAQTEFDELMNSTVNVDDDDMDLSDDELFGAQKYLDQQDAENILRPKH